MNIFKGKKPASTEPERKVMMRIQLTLSSYKGAYYSDEERIIEVESKETLTATTDAKTKELRTELENIISDAVAKFEIKFKESPAMTNGYHAEQKEQI